MRPLLREGETCWQLARASRVALLMDGVAYFSAARAALMKARRSIMLVGWDFDPRTRLEPGADGEARHNTLGAFLLRLKDERPDLDIRLLIWDMALPLAAGHDFFPQRARAWFDDRVRLVFDNVLPFGACHHQKILIIDDDVAFCGGGDFTPNRWDTAFHLDDDPHRILPSGRPYPPRHDMMMMVDGDAARALGDLARERWWRATGERLNAPDRGSGDIWPDSVAPCIRNVDIGIVRTEPEWNGRAAVRENERLYVEAIASARRLIFLENQYFTSTLIGKALAARLDDPDGPEIVVVCSGHSPGFSDSVAMDSARDALVAHLFDVDRFGRFRAYAPYTRGGKVIIVHSKVTIIDDSFLRIGSTNLNNRSMGYDTECDLAIEVGNGRGSEETRQAIVTFRHELIAHYLGLPARQVAEKERQSASVITAISELDGEESRLRSFSPVGPGVLGSLVAERHIGDPHGVSDAWRPWRRRAGPARAPWGTAAMLLVCFTLLAFALTTGP